VFAALDSIMSANTSSSRIATDIMKIEGGLTSAQTKEHADANELLIVLVPTLVSFGD